VQRIQGILTWSTCIQRLIDNPIDAHYTTTGIFLVSIPDGWAPLWIAFWRVRCCTTQAFPIVEVRIITCTSMTSETFNSSFITLATVIIACVHRISTLNCSIRQCLVIVKSPERITTMVGLNRIPTSVVNLTTTVCFVDDKITTSTLTAPSKKDRLFSLGKPTFRIII
jgi:hypothetical protein